MEGESLERERWESLRRWQLRKKFWRDKGRRGMLNMTWKNSKSGTSGESPKLPQNIQNFRRKSETSAECSELPRKCPELPKFSRKIQQILRFEQILSFEILEMDL